MPTETQTFACFVCEKDIVIKTRSGDSEESPEMFQIPLGASVGLTTVEDENGPGEEPEFIFTCSPECTEEFCAEDEEEDPAELQ